MPVPGPSLSHAVAVVTGRPRQGERTSLISPGGNTPPRAKRVGEGGLEASLLSHTRLGGNLQTWRTCTIADIDRLLLLVTYTEKAEQPCACQWYRPHQSENAARVFTASNKD